MAKPFDATLNALIDLGPAAWAAGFARLVGLPAGPCEVLDTDLATTVQADKLFRIGGPHPAVLHLELEANPRLGVPRDLLRYNTLIDHAHGLPVETVLVLLRPKAEASDQTGVYQRFGVGGRVITEFRYHVERVWTRPADFWLNAGLPLSPLALLTEEVAGNLEGAVDGYRERLRADAVPRPVVTTLLGSSYFLCGLRYDQEEVWNVFGKLDEIMEASSTYQATINKGWAKGLSEGRADAARQIVRRQGTKRFGEPSADAVARLDAITSPDHLDRLADRVLDATGWDDLLATP